MLHFAVLLKFAVEIYIYMHEYIIMARKTCVIQILTKIFIENSWKTLHKVTSWMMDEMR